MNIKKAQYYTAGIPNSPTNIKITEQDGKIWYVPQDANNTDYQEILRQVQEGTLTIQDAD